MSILGRLPCHLGMRQYFNLFNLQFKEVANVFFKTSSTPK